eukprot:GHVN01007028.1.p2 GENE.GHVN01007028.1~~GHVN01007028.1.p2  ORF type:complete len:478 (+),score=53.10 GHVN01007028.1:2-1435(+)
MVIAVATKQKADTKIKTSLQQTQQLVMTTFSCIGYLRDLFPEEAFEECKVADMSLRKIQRGCVSEADQFMDWIEKGCFDALAKKYLRSITLEIHGGEGEEPLETYEFNVTYPSSDVHNAVDKENPRVCLTLKNKGNEMAQTSDEEDFKKTAMKMLRSICLLTQTLDTLPEKKYLSMRLSYYDEVMKKPYEPLGFRAATDVERTALEQTELVFKYDFGVVKHSHHCINFGMVAKEGGELPTMQEETAGLTQAEKTFLETQANVPTQKTVEVPEVACMEKPVFPGVGISAILCHCGTNESDSDMIQCEVCFLWQHTVCAGFYSNKDKRIHGQKYECYGCKYKGKKNVFRFISELSCFRRVLSVIYNEGMGSIEGLSSRLGMPLPQTSLLVERGVQEGFLCVEDHEEPGTQTSEIETVKKYCVVKTMEIREKVKFYFNTDLEVYEGFQKEILQETPKRREAPVAKSKKRKLSISKKNIAC